MNSREVSKSNGPLWVSMAYRKGICIDIYAKDSECNVYDIEMMTINVPSGGRII